MKDNLTRDEATARAATISNLAYDVEFDFTKGDEFFGSETTVRFSAADNSENFIDLTSATNLKATLNGQVLDKEHYNDYRLRLPKLQETNELQISALMPYRNSGTACTFFRDPEDSEVYLHTGFEPFDAHGAFACFDQPNLKATFGVSVIGHDHWNVCANMPGTREANRWTFDRTPPISTYLVACVAGPFEVVTSEHNGTPLGLWCRKSLAKHLDAENIFDLTKAGLDWFGKAFDYPHPFPKYEHLFVPEFAWGAMENPGCVTVLESYIFRSRPLESSLARRAETILHEMSHMWFGNLVTMKWWDDLWLNESFATYAAFMAMSDIVCEPFRDKQEVWADFAVRLKRWAYAQDQLPSTHPVVSDMVDIDAVHLNFDGITYAKGASLLRQLVAINGEEAFLRGVRNYFKTHAWGNATLDDFLDALGEVSGEDMHAWSKQWLQTTGVGIARATVSIADATIESLTVDESSGRAQRMCVGLYDLSETGLTRRKHVELVVEGDTPVAGLVGDRAADLILVNDEDLAYTRIRLDDASLACATEHVADITDAQARALVFNAMSDMTRDGEMSARVFAVAVARNVVKETSNTLATSLVSSALGFLVAYADPARRDAARDQFAETMKAHSFDPEVIPSMKLLCVSAWIGTEAHDADSLLQLLDGTLVLENFEMDLDRRWGAISSLASMGHKDIESILNAQLKIDPSDRGARLATAARASVPKPEVKADAWKRLVNDDLSLHEFGALVSGFNDSYRDELMEPYTQLYFDEVVGFFERRGYEIGHRFAAALFPSDERAIEKAQDLLRTVLPEPLRRTVVEQLDQLERAIRNRAFDASQP